MNFSSHAGTYLLRSSICSATSSRSHFGVDVAPHTPTLSSALNHSLFISPTESMFYVLILSVLQRSHRTFPFELAFPDTKITMSCSSANFDSLSCLVATCEHTVSCTLRRCLPLKRSTGISLYAAIISSSLAHSLEYSAGLLVV